MDKDQTEEVIDQDELQHKDELNTEWVKAWKRRVKRKDSKAK
jgi:hypothetical protein